MRREKWELIREVVICYEQLLTENLLWKLLAGAWMWKKVWETVSCVKNSWNIDCDKMEVCLELKKLVTFDMPHCRKKIFEKILKYFFWNFLREVDVFFLHIWKKERLKKSFIWRIKVLLIVCPQKYAETLISQYLSIDWIFIIRRLVLQVCKKYRFSVSYMQVKAI